MLFLLLFQGKPPVLNPCVSLCNFFLKSVLLQPLPAVSAGTLALVLYTLVTRQVGVSSGAQAAQKLATRAASLRGIPTGLKPPSVHRTSPAAAGMSMETLRPVQKVVQGQKMMEGALPAKSLDTSRPGHSTRHREWLCHLSSVAAMAHALPRGVRCLSKDTAP